MWILQEGAVSNNHIDGPHRITLDGVYACGIHALRDCPFKIRAIIFYLDSMPNLVTCRGFLWVRAELGLPKEN